MTSSVLTDECVRDELRRAWLESNPGGDGPREEGGFVLRNPDGALRVERWTRGIQDRIFVPAHEDCQHAGLPILATFHTHPNTDPEYQQDPSPTDIRAVRDDPHLGGPDYEGELVISQKFLYRVLKDGTVEVLGDTSTLLGFLGKTLP